MSSKMFTPAHLQSGDTHLKALFEGPTFKVGDIVKLKGDDTEWTVIEIQDPLRECFVHRGWNNNI